MTTRPATVEEIKEIAFAMALWEKEENYESGVNVLDIEVENQFKILQRALVTAIEAHDRVTFTVMWFEEPILGVFVKNEGGISIIDSQLFLVEA